MIRLYKVTFNSVSNVNVTVKCECVLVEKFYSSRIRVTYRLPILIYISNILQAYYPLFINKKHFAPVSVPIWIWKLWWRNYSSLQTLVLLSPGIMLVFWWNQPLHMRYVLYLVVLAIIGFSLYLWLCCKKYNMQKFNRKMFTLRLRLTTVLSFENILHYDWVYLTTGYPVP